MLKTIARWLVFLIATLQFFSALINTADALTLMDYSLAAGIFGLLGAAASLAGFSAVMYGILRKKAWTSKAAAASAALNSAYVIVIASIPVPEQLLAGMGVPDVQAAAEVMWAFAWASIFLNAVMAVLAYLCSSELKD